MSIRSYVVTDSAGPWVAGRRVEPGDILTLPEADAEYEVARKQLEVVGAAKPKQADKSHENPANGEIDKPKAQTTRRVRKAAED